MLLCGIVNEISPLTKLRDEEATTLLSYFFCQATDNRINNAAAVLRGLIYLLIDQQPSLVSHVRKKYDHGVDRPFEGVNGRVALSTVSKNILQDPSLKSTYLIVDAIDECETDLPQLLKLGRARCASGNAARAGTALRSDVAANSTAAAQESWILPSRPFHYDSRTPPTSPPRAPWLVT
jgi:hypothetical protein